MSNDNFDAFISEVLSHGAEAVLPKSFNDYWFNKLLEKAYLIKEGNQTADDLKYVCGAIFLILQARTETREISVSDLELDALVRQYCTELQLEALNRYTEFSVSPATLGNIFSNRKVEVSRNIH